MVKPDPKWKQVTNFPLHISLFSVPPDDSPIASSYANSRADRGSFIDPFKGFTFDPNLDQTTMAAMSPITRATAGQPVAIHQNHAQPSMSRAGILSPHAMSPLSRGTMSPQHQHHPHGLQGRQQPFAGRQYEDPTQMAQPSVQPGQARPKQHTSLFRRFF